MYEKSRILVCNFLVSCDSRAGPVSQTAILEIFSRRYSKYQLKHKLLTALIMPREHKTRHTNNERESRNEKKSSMTAFPCYSEFTCAIFSISSISRLTIAYMWSNGVAAVCILVTRVVSFAFVNIYKIRGKKKMGFQNYVKIAVHKPLPCLRVQAMVVFNLLLDCKNARLSYMKKTSYLCKKIPLNNKQQTSRQTKTKQNEHIQTSERRKQYTRSINYSKKFTFGKI